MPGNAVNNEYPVTVNVAFDVLYLIVIYVLVVMREAVVFISCLYICVILF